MYQSKDQTVKGQFKVLIKKTEGVKSQLIFVYFFIIG